MSPSRLPRFKRVATTKALQLTDRDRTVIRLVYRHRFLRSSHLTSLLDGSPQQLLRRLQSLYHHGYLERPRAQIDYYHKGGSHPIVYGLGTKGGVIMKKELGAAFQKARWGEKNRVVGRMFLEHALLVSEVLVAIELACRERGDIRLLAADQIAAKDVKTGKPRPFQWKVSIKRGIKLGVIPDRIFALEYVGKTGARERAYFFLEADRGTMPVVRNKLSQTSFYRKLLAYEATWSQGIHRSRFGFHRFRVLCVATSANRVNSLVEACSRLERGHGLFLFADRGILENSAQLLSAPWQSGRQGEITSLVQ